MKLLHAPECTIRVIRESTSDDVPLCEVMIDGAPTGTLIQGAVLAAALRWQEFVLLFVTDDVPFEEGLNIYLLDQQLNVADYARMYFMYSTGVFSDLDLTEDDTVRFHFLGDKVWTLRLFARKKLALPIISAVLGVHRPWRFTRRFRLH
jgi:hypothetical protein